MVQREKSLKPKLAIFLMTVLCVYYSCFFARFVRQGIGNNLQSCPLACIRALMGQMEQQ